MPRRRPPDLFPPVRQDRAGEETEELYSLVVALRLRGFTVQRAGAAHVVNGKQFSTRQFQLFAHGIMATMPAPQLKAPAAPKASKPESDSPREPPPAPLLSRL